MDQTQTKLQKSNLWIWTTLWLTAFIDSGIIYFVFSRLVSILVLPDTIKGFFSVVAFMLALWLGAYVAVKYVLKRSIVKKEHASRFAALAVVVPVLFSILKIFVNIGFQTATNKIVFISTVGSIASIAIVYISVKKLVLTRGD